MTWYEWIAWFAQIATVVIAGLGALFGVGQLRQLVAQVKGAVEANELSRLDALLQMERNVNDTRTNLALSAAKVGSFENKPEVEPGEFKVAEMAYREDLQRHLNALDRLCFCITRGLLNEQQLRPEYRDYISGLVRQHKDEFGTGTHYRNIVAVYEKWAAS